MSLNTLIPTTYSGTFEKRLKDELIIGKLATTKFESNLKHGDEVDVAMPGTVTTADWSGGDLDSVEKMQASIVKVKANKGKQVNFELEKDKEIQINKAKGSDKIALIKEYTNDAMYQFRDAVDTGLGNLYTKAGYVIDNEGNALAITQSNVVNQFVQMATKFKRGHKGSAWKEGSMAAILPPEMVELLVLANAVPYVESTKEELEKGFVGRLGGFKIYESNNIYKSTDSTPIYYPLFGIEGESMASIVQKNMELIPYMRDESLNKAFKGAGVYGVEGHRSDKLGTIKCTLSVA